MMAHKICFSEERWIIIPKLSFLSGALAIVAVSCTYFHTSELNICWFTNPIKEL